jgi:threonine aldolase
MPVVNLYSDNVAPVADEVLQALLALNHGTAPGYGADAVTARLEARFSELFETSVSVFPVATGTAANALSLSAITPPYGAIYCSDTGHIHDSECGATEFFSGGAKTVPLPAAHGRLDAGALTRAIAGAGVGRAHKVQPAGVSLTQATERGTVYPLESVAEISAVARSHGLKVHMDGARFANATAALGATPAQMTWQAGVDVLSFGATKNGAMSTDAIIVFDRGLAQTLRYRCRRAGQVLSKMRYAAAQLEAMIENDLWLRLARHANAMAARLSAGLASVPGTELLHPVEINEVFVRLPTVVMHGLERLGYGLVDRGDGTVRLVTAFSVSPADIDELIARAHDLAGHTPAA